MNAPSDHPPSAMVRPAEPRASLPASRLILETMIGVRLRSEPAGQPFANAAGPSSRRMSMMCPVCPDSSTSSDCLATSGEDSRVPGGSSPNAFVRIGVPVRSGLMQFTRTPVPAHSSARAWVRLTTAALAEE